MDGDGGATDGHAGAVEAGVGGCGGGCGRLRSVAGAQLREEAAKAEQLAKESGTQAKSAAVIRQLERRWREFLDAHGEAYGYEEAAGPTIELAVHFQVRDGARGRACWWEGAMRQVVSRAAWAAGRGWARGWA